MNPNRFTEKAQEAIVAAQNETTRRNHAQLEPEHLLWALLSQADGIVPQVVLKLGATRRRCCARCRARSTPRRSCNTCRSRPSDRPAQRRCRRPRTRRRRSRTSTSPPSTCCWRHGRTPRAARPQRILRDAGVTRDSVLRGAAARCAAASASPSQNPEGTYQALEKYGRDLTELARAGQARPGHRPRRGDPPRHPGALAPHQEQPGADRRAGRRQDRHRRGAGPAHRPRRRARGAARTSASSRSTWAR